MSTLGWVEGGERGGQLDKYLLCTGTYSALWVTWSLISLQINREHTHTCDGEEGKGEEWGVGRGLRSFVKHLRFLSLAHTLEGPWQKLNGRK